MSKKILYISSFNPIKGPGAIAMDHYNALLQAGFEVDFLTKFPVEGHPEIKYTLKRPINRYLDFLRRFSYYSVNKIVKSNRRDNESPRYLTHRKENEPPVSIKKILKKLNNNYDLVIIFFSHGLLTYKTIKKIYENNVKPLKVVLLSPDYLLMTGGCDHIGNCTRYIYGCGMCPMINSTNPKDFTSWNVKYGARVVREVKPYVFVNNFMLSFFENSTIMKEGARFIKSSMIIDLEKFKPLSPRELRRKYEISDDKTFIILFGAQDLSNERKGMKYLIESLHKFYNKLNEVNRKNVLLLIIGKSEGISSSLPPFKQKHLGYVSVDKLPEIYSIANIYVSPSINDPGPSMVNQAIACGTPVIAFKMGTALEVIKDKGSGICVPLKDTEKFCNAIEKIYNLNPDDYNRMRKTARKVAEELHSYKHFSSKIADILKD